MADSITNTEDANERKEEGKEVVTDANTCEITEIEEDVTDANTCVIEEIEEEVEGKEIEEIPNLEGVNMGELEKLLADFKRKQKEGPPLPRNRKERRAMEKKTEKQQLQKEKLKASQKRRHTRKPKIPPTARVISPVSISNSKSVEVEEL